jgi:hypothetical protein
VRGGGRRGRPGRRRKIPPAKARSIMTGLGWLMTGLGRLMTGLGALMTGLGPGGKKNPAAGRKRCEGAANFRQGGWRIRAGSLTWRGSPGAGPRGAGEGQRFRRPACQPASGLGHPGGVGSQGGGGGSPRFPVLEGQGLVDECLATVHHSECTGCMPVAKALRT